jgi:hypothetical protein
MHSLPGDRGVGQSGLSWNGFNVFGDRKSIDEVGRLMYVSGTWETVDSALRERIKKLEIENLTLLNSQAELIRRLGETQADRDNLAVRVSKAKGALEAR